jgi:hypothetical protein
VEEAAYKVLTEFPEDALPTEEEDVEFEASYAKAKAAVKAQQAVEDLPRVPKKKWGVN